jgi:phage shock protein PspC (stress-responsive transcriptional regulator)
MKTVAVILIVLVVAMILKNGSIRIKEGVIMANDYKELRRSSTNKVICGVCGGIGEYFNVDPTIIRVLFVLIGCTGTGLLAYLLMAVIIPE